MHVSQEIQTVIGLLVAVTALVTLARRLAVPYPILLFVGGAVLGFLLKWVRFTSDVALEPEVVFLLFLPPLLYAESWWTSWRDFKANARPIALLAFGLVLTTTTAVALVAHHFIPGMAWGPAFVLGAVLAPTDTVAPAAILHRLRAPRRIVVVLDGESLVNDATALVAYRAAVAAVVVGTFSPAHAALSFALAIVGGVAVGLAVGVAAAWLHKLQRDYATSITLSLLVPFSAYLAGEAIHASGVVAVVVAGIYVGRRGPRILSAVTRVRAVAFWDVLVFLLNGLLFILVGLQLPAIFRAACGRSFWPFVGYGALISLTLIAVRFAWVFPATYLPRLLFPSVRRRDPYPNWRPVMVVAWTGLRGGVSLAAALAIPAVTSSGAPFPLRDLILFLTFCSLLATLVGQGLLLAPLIKGLGLKTDGADEREESIARAHAARTALDRLGELAGRHPVPTHLVDRLRERYASVVNHAAGDSGEASNGAASGGQSPSADPDAYRRLRRELLRVERDAVIGLRDRGAINDDVLHRIERDLDLDELRLGDTAGHFG
jgi:monovalent cation/hydrogen antiporter